MESDAHPPPIGSPYCRDATQILRTSFSRFAYAILAPSGDQAIILYASTPLSLINSTDSPPDAGIAQIFPSAT